MQQRQNGWLDLEMSAKRFASRHGVKDVVPIMYSPWQSYVFLTFIVIRYSIVILHLTVKVEDKQETMDMRETIEKIVAGEDALFESLIKQLGAANILAFAQSEDPEGLTLNFLNYLLEDDQEIEYIPLFTDQEEVNAFVADADVPDGYTLYEFEGDLFADIMDNEQYLMINPVSGGIVFQGGHLKAFALPANDDKNPA